MPNENNDNRRLTVYGLTALATTGALTVPQHAEAIPVEFSSGLTTKTSTVGVDDPGRDVFFDFTTGTSSFSNVGGFDFSLKTFVQSITSAIAPQATYRKASLFWGRSGNYWEANTAPNGSPLRLPSNATIGPRNVFAYRYGTLASTVGRFGYWNSFGRGFAGLKFQMADGTHFGWADLTVHNDFTITLNRFGYETDPNVGIKTPQVAGPEPNALELLLLGFPAIGAYRLRQKSRRAKAAS